MKAVIKRIEIALELSEIMEKTDKRAWRRMTSEYEDMVFFMKPTIKTQTNVICEHTVLWSALSQV